MIVQRMIVQYKVGKVQEALQLVKSEIERIASPNAIRLYVPQPNELNTLVAEYEFENSAVAAEFWKSWEAQPEAQVFLEKFEPLVASPMTTELYELA